MNRKFVLLFFVFFAATFVFSAAPPGIIKELREKAPENLVGAVTGDRLVKKIKEGFIREFSFKIDMVVKTRTGLKTGDRIVVRYYIPFNPQPGPGGIESVETGSTVQLWLNPTTKKSIYVGAALSGSKRKVKPGDDYLSHWDYER